MWPRNGARVTGAVQGDTTEGDGGSQTVAQTMSSQGTEMPAQRRGRGRRALTWTALSLTLVLVGSGAAAYGYYRKLQGNIKREDVGGLLGDNRPKKLSQAMNILLIGSDSRGGENAAYGSTPGARADTTILLHLSPGGDKAIGMSFPRDLMVNIPACRRKQDGPATPPRFGMINSAFAHAGASCTWKTIESLTQIHIDHYVEIDFAGFKQVVDALGGVEICLPHAVDDPKAKLDLPAGRQTVKGDAALGYVRTRTGGLGDGSDLSRIDRQKRFMSAVVQKATSTDMLTDPTTFVRVLDAATRSITADKDFSVGAMRRLAGGLKGMNAGGVRFVTVPFAAYAPDRNRVALDRTRAEPLFAAIRTDTKVPDTAPARAPAKAVKPVHRGLVRVRIYNGAGTPGLAAQAADQLRAGGFQVVGTGPLPSGTAAKTRIRYGHGGARQAATLAAVLPGVAPISRASVPAGVVHLVLGRGWKGFNDLMPTGTGEVRADQNICKTAT
jgi:LCP family protein required for cell wall assembly